MTDDLAASFLRVHSDFRSAMNAIVRQFSDEDLANTRETYASNNLHNLPYEQGLVAVAVRRACRLEQTRRAAAVAAEKETEA